MRRFAVLALVTVAAAGGAAALLGNGPDAHATAPEPGLHAVKRGTLAVTLTETGTLKTKNATSIRPEVDGHLKIAWLIEEGAEVAEGAPVLELDKTDMEKAIEDLVNREIQGESELKTARVDLDIQEGDNRTEIEKATLKLEVATVNLKKLVHGDIPKETRTRKLRIDKARSAFQRAEERFKTMPELLDLGFVTKSQVDEERLKVEEARVELEAAEQDLALYDEFQRPIDLKTKEAEVTEGERTLARAQQKAASQLEQRQAVVRQRELALKATKDKLEQMRKNLEKMTLRAPTRGLVLYGDPAQPWYRDEVKVGNQVWRNRTLLTIPDTSEMAVMVKVHEADVNQLKTGMPVAVTLDTYKGLVLTGEVVKIASVANANDGRDDEVKKFSVDIEIKERGLSLRPGITAKAEIRVGELKDVLHVPAQAIQAKDGKYRCFVRRGGRTIGREVEIGRANEHFVEVTRGIAEGDQVMLFHPETVDAEEALPLPPRI